MMTKRAILTILVSVLLYILLVGITLFFLNNSLLNLIFVVLETIFIPIIVGVTNIIVFVGTYPVREYVKNSAKNKIAKKGGLTVIAIAGSHGKTTTKNFLGELLKYHYKTEITPGNVNTPLGIANWINKEIRDGTQVIIAEVDTYWPGEIYDACRILKPKHTILTSLGNQHLMRFKNRDELHKSILEVFKQTNGLETKIAAEETKETVHKNGLTDVEYVEDTPKYRGAEISSPQLSSTQKKNLALALRMAEKFDISENIVNDTCSKLIPPDRRQKTTVIKGFDAVDDSYNISLETAKAGVERAELLAKEKNKKLIVVTAGIAELGAENIEANRTLGKILKESADEIAILESDFYKEIVEGIGKSSKYKTFSDLNKFWSYIETLPKDEWILLQQPELTDLNY